MPELIATTMRSPGGWIEPGRTPEFDEFTLVLAVCLPAFSPLTVHRDSA